MTGTVVTRKEHHCDFSGEVTFHDVIVSERRFAFWRLEFWWVFLDNPSYYPKYRKNLYGRWFWRESIKSINRKEKILNTSKKLGI